MEFLQPLALLGLAGAAVPALLHLFQRRELPSVEFPAVRYLVEAERRHSQRVRLRNLLLLVLRTLLIAALALAAARPVIPSPLGVAHAPSAVVVVLDNSLSSGVASHGRPRVEEFRAVAAAIAARAEPGDALWLLTADGIPRRLPAGEWESALAGLDAEPGRLDIGAAVRAAGRLLADENLPGTVVVLSDAQESAVTSGEPPQETAVLLEPGAPPPNRGIDSVRAEPEVWTPGGQILASVGGNDTVPGELTLELGGRVLGRGLAVPGETTVLTVERLTSGWHAARLVLAPDELRADDVRYVALRAGPVAGVTATDAGSFVEAALAALATAGRVRSGRDVVIGAQPAAGRSIVLPPADPARVAAANRALAARGVPVRFGPVLTGEWRATSALATLGDATVRRRYRLEGNAAALATAGGEPWLVRHGTIVVLASRMDEEWTDLPLTPAFVPFLDALVNRLGAGEAWRVQGVPGAEISLPGSAAMLLLPGGNRPVSGGRAVEAPAEPGVYFVVGSGGDTVGALEVNPDPRESDLRVASRALLRQALGHRVRLAPSEMLPGLAFAARRAELTSTLLIAALALAVLEFAFAATAGARRSGI